MPCRFDHYIGIDYSGAGTPTKRSPTIQVYHASREGSKPAAVECVQAIGSSPKRRRNWNRFEVFHWLARQLKKADERGERCLIGMDHGFSFPSSYFERYGLKTWNQFLQDFAEHWPTDQPDVTVESLRANSARVGTNDELRLTERWTSSAKSVFQFDVNGSVAKSTHAGLPFLQKLRQEFNQRLHCWPFDGWDVGEANHAIVEIYPSLFRNRYPRADRSVDQQDAYSVSRWLAEMDQAGSLDTFFHPPLTASQSKQAKKEGWILGVM